MNKVDVSFVDFLKEQITKKDSVIEKLQSQLDEREKNWVNQFELIKKMLPLPKEEAKTPVELFSDRSVEMQRNKEAIPEPARGDYEKDNIPDLAQSVEQPRRPEPESVPKNEPVPPSEPNPDTRPKPPTESYESTAGDTAQFKQPQQPDQLESNVNNRFSEDSYTQRQNNDIGVQ